ncbi:MAG: arsenate reductase ArsC [Acidaminococcaceae bacterium]
MNKNRPKVAFVCVHNSCRSQMAEATAKILAADVFEAYSAGTEKENEINPVAVEVIKELYAVDMTATQHVKLLEALPRIDILVTMGCNVTCPYLPCQHREDWGLEDPSGKDKEAFLKTALLIKEKVLDLKKRIESGQLK